MLVWDGTLAVRPAGAVLSTPMAMKITTSISINVEGDSEALRERELELAQQEIMRYSAALADRLEEEGIEDVTIGIEGDE